MHIRQLDRAALDFENGAHTQRLLPWPVLNAPFEGSWAIVPPGGASGAHSHHEHEIFIATRGAATVECDGETSPFVAGDIAHFVPGTRHRVINSGDADFEFYCIWWDTDLAGRFAERVDRREQSDEAAAGAEAAR